MSEQELRDFIASHDWVEAITYKETAPHEYLVCSVEADEETRKPFEDFVATIRQKGYQQKFWSRHYTYYDIDGYKYWTMGAPVNETVVLNRVKI